MPHAALPEETFAEGAVRQKWQDLGRDSSRHVDTPGGERLQRQVSRLRAIDGSEGLHDAAAERIGLRRRSDDCGSAGAVGTDRVDYRIGNREGGQMRDRLREIDDSIAGKHPLPGDMLV